MPISRARINSAPKTFSPEPEEAGSAFVRGFAGASRVRSFDTVLPDAPAEEEREAEDEVRELEVPCAFEAVPETGGIERRLHRASPSAEKTLR